MPACRRPYPHRLLCRATPKALDVQGDWDAFGQRATFSGTTIIDSVRVPRTSWSTARSATPACWRAQFAGNQLIHAAIEAGSALAAVRHRRRGRRPQGPRHIAYRISRCAPKPPARWCCARPARSTLRSPIPTTAPPSSHAVIGTDQAKSLAYELAPAGRERAARSFAAPDDPEAAELERLWRNVRTHSLHDPVRWRQHFVGDFHLNNRLSRRCRATRFGLVNPATQFLTV